MQIYSNLPVYNYYFHNRVVNQSIIFLLYRYQMSANIKKCQSQVPRAYSDVYKVWSKPQRYSVNYLRRLRKPENINISETVTSEFLSVLSGIAAD